MKKIFKDVDLQFVYRNKLLCNISQIRKIYFELYKKKWDSDILCKPKLRTYILIKDSFGPEPYVTLNLTRAQRSVCAQLRCGTLPLALETGRFHSVPEEERICTLCDLIDIENEMHFLFYCPLYCDLRNELFFDLSLFSMSDEERLTYLFKNCIFKLAKFVLKAWERRKRTLFV